MDGLDKGASVHFLGVIQTLNIDKLKDSKLLIIKLNSLLNRLQVKSLGLIDYSFADGEGQYGYTVMFCLAESHIAIHTWPEYGCAEFDVYLCNYLSDNQQKSRNIFNSIISFFEADLVKSQEIKRPMASNAFLLDKPPLGRERLND